MKIALPFFKQKEAEMPEKLFEGEAIKAIDIIAPSSIEIKQSFLKLGERLTKSFFFFYYPR